MATAEKGFQANSIHRSWGGISAYRVSVSRSSLGTRRGLSIMDKLLIRWELWPTLPSICVCLLPHPSHPLPPLELASCPRLRLIFRDWTATPENAPNRPWLPRGRNTTFHFNYSIDFLPVYCRFFLSFFLSFPSSLLFVFPGSLSAASGTRDKIMHTH